MITSERLDADKIEIRMRGRIAELEKANQALRAELLERSHSEEALRKSEEKYRTLFNSIDEGFFLIEVIFDSKGKAVDYRILEANQSQEKVTGLQDVKSKQVRKLVPYMDDNWIKNLGQVVLTGDSIRFENRVESTDRWFDVRFSRVGDEYNRKVAVLFKDITERKKAEEALLKAYENIQGKSEELYAQSEELREANEALRESEELYCMLFDHSVDTIILSNPEDGGKILSANSTDCRILRWKEELISKESSLMLDLEDPDLSALLKEDVFSEPARTELICRCGDGTTLLGDVITAFFTDNKGESRTVAIIRDIKESKRMEKTLRENEACRKVADAVKAERERLNSVLNILPAYMILLSKDYRVPFANHFFEERFGKSEGRRCYEYIFQRTEPCENCETYKVLKTGATHHWEWLGPDNRNYDIYDYPFRDSDGSTLIMEVGIDITERKNNEMEIKKHREHLEELVREQTEELAESEKRFRTLAENSPDVIARFDRQNRHLYVNPAYVEVYGHSQEKVIGKTHTELGRDPEQVEFWRERHEKVFATGKPETMEFEYTSPQGKKYYFNTLIVPEFVENKVASVLAISRDIKDIKEAEIKLKETLDNLEKLVEDRTSKLEKAYRSLKENEKGLAEAQKIAHLGNWNWNIVTNELYWSDEIYRIFGRSPQEFGATYDAFLSYVHPEDRDYVKNAVNGALAGRPYSIDHRIILASGEERIVHEQGEVIFGKGNMPVRMVGIVQDITDRKKAEKALELANAYNRSLIEASLDPLVTIGPDGKITDVNKATESVTGYSRKELIGTDFSNYFTESEKAKEGYKQVFREGLVLDYALEIQHRNGHITPVLYNASVYRDEDGEVIGVFAAARDVTEQKRAEKALKLANAYNRSLIEASVDPLVTIGPDGKITDVNNSTESITGYSRKELIGTDFSDYFTEPEKARKGYQHVFKKGLVRDYPLEIRHKNGHTTPVLYNASVYRNENGEVTGVFAAARDITELKKAEEKIRTLANVVESSNDAIITESLEGIIISWNKGAEQVYGYLAEEVLGKNMSILEPDNLKGEIKQLADRVKQGKKVKHHETLRRKKDGTILNISVTLSPVFDVSGKLVAISNIAGDITETKISEHLFHEKQMAEIANRTKSEFLANMSHELRTPLNSIIGFSDMLHEQAYGELNRKQLRAVGNISNSGKHLLNLINGILDLSKIEANKMELNYREFELATKLDLIRNVLYPIAEKKNIEIEIDMDKELTRIRADEEKFTRIMYNLVDNAIKFSYGNSLVKIGARKKGDLVEITVKDAGIGIKAEDQHKLFKPFSQINSFSSKKFQGTGLGLSLVKQIVNLHGGYVWFRSSPGEGSTFAFVIPITTDLKVLVCCH